MILIADSGSTTTSWVLVKNKQVIQRISTQGLNPYFTSETAMARILGYDSPQTLMAAVKDIAIDLYCSREARDLFLQQMNRLEPVSAFEVEFFRKDGTRIWVSLHARPVTDAKEKLCRIEGIIFDITQQKKEADALREREEYLRKENIRLRSNIKDRYRFGDLIGKSEAMQSVYELILKAAATDANVIDYGESGTGKELVALEIYRLSDRKKGRFVPVNCGAIPENLLESEFFGYKKGAFTGANTSKAGYLDQADRGVLFLDELGEISAGLQVKLLRVLEGGGYTPVGGLDVKTPDLRIIAATNRDLEKQVNRGIMREDFFYRIHIIPIHLPPLRERKEDIPLLIEHFLKDDGKKKRVPPVTGDMIEAMKNYHWPGNVRELQNVLHRYRSLGHFDLPTSRPGASRQLQEAEIVPSEGVNFHDAVKQFEKKLLIRTLEAHRWHRENAAKSLGLPPRTFFRRLKEFGLTRLK